MRYIFGLIAVVVAGFYSSAFAQGTGLPLGAEAYHILDRLMIKTAADAPMHSSLKHYTRESVVKMAWIADSMRASLSGMDLLDLQYLYDDNNEWSKGLPVRQKKPLFGFAYPGPANFLELNEPDFHLRLNPMLNINMAPVSTESEPVFINQRGLELRGGVDDRLYFYVNILESQARFPAYVQDRVSRDKALPGASLYKGYNSQVFGLTNGYDFLNGQGYLGFNITPHVGAQMGYGRHFIGNGYRSLLLSDFAQHYSYLRLNWQVWKLHYQNIFAELDLRSANFTRGDRAVTKKHMAMHHLSINLGSRLNLGIFEAVIYDRPNNIAIQYLNPVIFYRAVEHATGSPDNVLLGADGRLNLARRVQLYGQFVLDELVFRELITDNRGWWANKYALQAGLKYVDVLGIDHLDIQAEYNFVRPYTYSHRDSTSSYTHHHQPLAHPLGANFKETVFILRYRPLPRIFVEARHIRALVGEDGPGANWGNNILLDHQTRVQEYGHVTGQGLAADIGLWGLDVSYQLAHNFFLDLQYFYRNKRSDVAERRSTLRYFGGGIRLNMPRLRMDF
jgi:hypothetical protein